MLYLFALPQGPQVIFGTISHHAATPTLPPNLSISWRLNPTPLGHYIYLRRFVPSPFFVLSETCCFLMLSSSAFLSLPGQAQILASKHRRPRTCPLGIREKRKKTLQSKTVEDPWSLCWSSQAHHSHPCSCGCSEQSPQSTWQNTKVFVCHQQY